MLGDNLMHIDENSTNFGLEKGLEMLKTHEKNPENACSRAKWLKFLRFGDEYRLIWMGLHEMQQFNLIGAKLSAKNTWKSPKKLKNAIYARSGPGTTRKS